MSPAGRRAAFRSGRGHRRVVSFRFPFRTASPIMFGGARDAFPAPFPRALDGRSTNAPQRTGKAFPRLLPSRFRGARERARDKAYALSPRAGRTVTAMVFVVSSYSHSD